MTQLVRFKIYAQWEKEAKLWVASSSDIFGLATKAKTLLALEHKLNKIVPELFELNGIKGEAALIVNSAI